MCASTGVAGTALAVITVVYLCNTASDEVVDVFEYEWATSTSELSVSPFMVDCDLQDPRRPALMY
jgi:hypothetical protein